MNKNKLNRFMQAKYAIIDGKIITLIDERVDISWRDQPIENIKINFLDNKIIISGDEVMYGFNLHGSHDNEIDLVVDKHTRTAKRFIFFGKKYKYVKKGWFEYKARREYNAVMTNYKIVDDRIIDPEFRKKLKDTVLVVW